MSIGLEVRQLSKHYGAQRVVSDVSLSVPNGEFVCFLGPSGCGKTTLLRMIAGLEVPSAGRILMNHQDITDTPVHQRNFAMVFQALALFPFLNVEENIAYSLRFRTINAQQRHEMVRDLLALIRLPDIGQRRIDQLSGGQRQRVAIARALAQEPMLFLLDEPLSALDAKLRDHMQVELRQLQQKLHITTVLVTHDQREAMSLADTLVVMADGRIQQIGSPTQIYRQPANRFVASFIGRSNLIDAQVEDRWRVNVGRASIGPLSVPRDLPAGAGVTLAVRPEDVRVLTAGDTTPNCLPGRVTFVRDVGNEIELRIDCDGREIIAATSPAAWAALSSTIHGVGSIGVLLPPESCHLLSS
ncbi:MAG TPA: ABC transporter ATP-binding protein [Steroidobacteraceae bacterium]|jgi:putative spermidine/putrescine transport system ATP-binding protein|nr:ABC transporter ATP-binding protein [Steroidobacteraceae bacterium]